MTSNVLLSVIIPIYNCEKYIDKCLSSFLDSNNENFEIILINDGSTDKSLSICKKYSKTDKRIKLFSFSNSGPSVARNKGIEKANGKYIFFCDGDDYVSTEEFKNVLIQLEEKDYDLYIFNSCYEGSKEGKYIEDDIGFQDDSDIDELHKYMYAIRISAPWKKIYCTKVLKEHNVLFPENRIIHEDLIQTINYMYNLKNVLILKQRMYYHRYSDNSLSKHTSFSMFSDLKKSYEELEKFYQQNKIKINYLNIAKNRYLAIIMGLIVRMKKINVSDNTISSELKKNDIDYIFKGIRLNSLKNIIRILFFKFRKFYLYSLLYRNGKK